MKILTSVTIILLALISLYITNTSNSYKRFQIENYKNFTIYDIPINTEEEALAYANKENVFRKFDLKYLREKGYKNFSVLVYKRSPDHLVSFFKERYKNDLDSKDEFNKNLRLIEKYGKYWQVSLKASGLIPIYSCNFYVKPTGEIILLGWSGCGYDK